MDFPDLKEWRENAVVIMSATGLAFLPFFIGLHYSYELWAQLYIDFGAVGLLTAAIAVDRLADWGQTAAVLAVSALYFALLSVGARGVVNVFVWTAAAPLVVFVLLDFEYAIRTAIAGGVALLIVTSTRSIDQLQPGLEVGISLAYVTFAGIAGYYEYLRDRYEERIEELSCTDPLTGLANRRRLMDRLESELERADRFGTTLSVLLLDLDNFKWFNDEHGHVEGDRILERAADLIRDNVRACDHVGRYGGDEFVLIAPRTEDDPEEPGAATLASRISDRISSISMGNRSLSTSIGVAEYGSGDDAGALLRRADRALYRAKDDESLEVCFAESSELRGEKPTPPAARATDRETRSRS